MIRGPCVNGSVSVVECREVEEEIEMGVDVDKADIDLGMAPGVKALPAARSEASDNNVSFILSCFVFVCLGG